MISATEYMQAAKRFESIFGLNLNEYCDPYLTTESEFAIDLQRLADYLDERYPYLEKDGVALQDVIRMKYGEEGENLIMRMI